MFLSTPGVTFFGIQTGAAAAEMAKAPAGVNLVGVSHDLHDLDEAAALMMNLDLVISVCTAPAHLAGALGVPVWTVLHRSAEWRWLRDRSDSPWYPTMRLFRQPREGDWVTVAADVAVALKS